MRHKRVFWILIGNVNTGSSRIHGYNVHKSLLAKGIKSKILKEGSKPLKFKEKLKILFLLKKGDLIIFQKRKEFSLRKLLFCLKLKKVKIAFIDCDLPKCNDSLVHYFDYIIVSSKSLLKLYKEHHPTKKIFYVPDAVEHFIIKKPIFNKKIIFFGWLTDFRIKKISSLKEIIEPLGWEIYTMSNNSKADIIWNNWSDFETFKIISQHSVSLIVVDGEASSKYKSANRVLQSQAIGNIVLCSDIESYREVINNGENGYICSTNNEWKNALNQILDINIRDKIIGNGYNTAQKYKMDEIVLMWILHLEL